MKEFQSPKGGKIVLLENIEELCSVTEKEGPFTLLPCIHLLPSSLALSLFDEKNRPFRLSFFYVSDREAIKERPFLFYDSPPPLERIYSIPVPDGATLYVSLIDLSPVIREMDLSGWKERLEEKMKMKMDPSLDFPFFNLSSMILAQIAREEVKRRLGFTPVKKIIVYEFGGWNNFRKHLHEEPVTILPDPVDERTLLSSISVHVAESFLDRSISDYLILFFAVTERKKVHTVDDWIICSFRSERGRVFFLSFFSPLIFETSLISPIFLEYKNHPRVQSILRKSEFTEEELRDLLEFSVKKVKKRKKENSK